MGWGEEETPSPARCARCGGQAAVMVLRQSTVTFVSLTHPGKVPEVMGSATAQVLCTTCAAPTAFANSPEVRQVLEGTADVAVLRVKTRTD